MSKEAYLILMYLMLGCTLIQYHTKWYGWCIFSAGMFIINALAYFTFKP